MKKLFPKEIILETTNYCNLKCRFCHFHGSSGVSTRPKGYMAESLWKKVLDELNDLKQATILCLHGAGEPLLYPKLKRLVKEAKKNPLLHVGFMTNGMLLTPDWSDFLLNEGVDWLAFSVDGVRPETNDFFRRGASLEKVEKNISYLIETKERQHLKKPAISFNMVAYPEIADQAQEYVRKWLPFSSYVSISSFRPIGSKRLCTDDKLLPGFTPCPLLYSQLVISWDGKAGLCCEDIFLDVLLGNIQEKSVMQIFNSAKMQTYRMKHEQGDKDSLPICKECDVWASSKVIEEKELVMNGQDVLYRRTYSGELYRPMPLERTEK